MDTPITRRTFLVLAGSGALVYSLGGCNAAAGEEEDAPGPNPFKATGQPAFSGIYPHLAFFNDHGECGVGAVVPWAGRLWAITYGPHFPQGSTDKLYEIDERLSRTVRPESVGGTHANRMIHVESEQLFIGPYVIDEAREVRVLSPKVMPGRLTGTARHLSAPAEKVYFATMEEGFYEVDVHTLDIEVMNPDGNVTDTSGIGGELLPGYHGKGLYSGQGLLVYANNGENSPAARERPDIPAGALAEWDGEAWAVVRRNQFTEVTGPGGITGNLDQEAPLWSYGWDHRSAIFMLLDGGTWRSFRLPKASHTYDGAHGWHTEWPRIRAISEDRMLMTMHGMFWDFPKQFSASDTAGIRPLSTYLKIIGDFCAWEGQVVCGCDDAAQSEFSEGSIRSQGTMVERSNSNLWFVDPDRLDGFGAPLGRGGPWVDDAVEAGAYSEPFLLAGFDHRMAHISHEAGRPVTFTFEVAGGGLNWRPLTSVTVPASGYAYHLFDEEVEAEWIRVKTDTTLEQATLLYQLADQNERAVEASPAFEGLAKPGQSFTSGIVRSGAEGRLAFAAQEVTRDGDVREVGYYETGPDMSLRRADESGKYRAMLDNFAPPEPPYTVEETSVVVTADSGQRYHLPKGPSGARELPTGLHPRAVREVVTERSLFNCQGHLYELPRANSGGFSKIRPVATSDFQIMDLCSWRGLLVLAGVATDGAVNAQETDNPHVVRSVDGQCALWFGVVDDLWELGKPRGEGGPWKSTRVQAGETSDPYLMTGYDHKELTLAHEGSEAVHIDVEVDIAGTGHWVRYERFEVRPGEPLRHTFPAAFNAYWVRFRASQDARATAQLHYT